MKNSITLFVHLMVAMSLLSWCCYAQNQEKIVIEKASALSIKPELSDPSQLMRLVAPRPSFSGKYLAYNMLTGTEKLMFIWNKTNKSSIELKTSTSIFRRQAVSQFDLQWRPRVDQADEGEIFLFITNQNHNQNVVIGEIDSTGIYLMFLTTDPAVDEQGRWSPDGSKIVFVSTRNKKIGADLYLIDDLDSIISYWRTNRQGKSVISSPSEIGLTIEPQKITDLPSGVLYPAWSGDDRFIAFSYWTEEEKNSSLCIGVVALNENTTLPYPVIRVTKSEKYNEIAPSWSFDNRYIAFYSISKEDLDFEKELRIKTASYGYIEWDQNNSHRAKFLASQGTLTADPFVDTQMTGPVWIPESHSLILVKHDLVNENPIIAYCVENNTINPLDLGTRLSQDLFGFNQKEGEIYLYLAAVNESGSGLYRSKINLGSTNNAIQE